ncbi:major facilitator superfamily protein (plasmid) [Rhizobium etli]|uniref:Major facilitator superfamily protein n=1 Tax=Rhizobium etli TaxID=29449 RepID=A0AAN1BM31_RHIET|nr:MULTISPECIES: MFS transporter [Rhizobium]ARO32729.1 major facilitator superfamily protein [Rhizobium sp. NXC14]ARQ13537.1 major facilitator superfamily protein [Rhizobium etli]
MQVEDISITGSTTLDPLRNAAFRSIWSSTQAANLGWLVQTVAISWLMATITASDLMVALVQASTTLPAFILSIIAGAIADTYSRRSVMITGLSLIALASVALTVSAAFGFISPWLILALGFVAGCGFALNDPAWHASVGDILDKRDIPAAVTLMSVGYNVTRSVGPALGGAIVAFLGPLAAFLFSACSNLAPLGAVLRNKWHVCSSPLPAEQISTAVHDGIRFTALSSDIRAAIIRATLFGFAAIAILALLPLVARDRLAGGPITYGVLFAGFGTGACIAGLNNRLLRKLIPQEWLMAIASVAGAGCCISLALTSSLPVAVLALALGGAGWVVTWTGFDVWVQLASPRWVVGRTLSIYYAFLSGGMAAGSWIWGTVAQTYSLTSSLELAAAVLLLVAASGFVLTVDLAAEGDQHGSVYPAPAVALDLMPRSGPIAARTEYSIDENDLNVFLHHMRTRRYALTRAGARDWTLQRNLRKPSRWTETFRTPTWMDFLRLHHRLSPFDQEVVQLLAALHMSDKPPETDLSIERTTDARRTRSQAVARVSRP